MTKKRVVIVDDHSMFIQGLSLVIDNQPGFEVAGFATNARESLALIARESPDLALVDLNLGDEDGLDLIARIRDLYPAVKSLALSMRNERYWAERALASGARGYVMKEEAASTLLEAMNTVLEGRVWLSAAEQSRIIDAAYSSPRADRMGIRTDMTDGLTTRQLQILRLLGKGHGTVEIAEELSISRKTVESHKEQLKLKLKCGSSQELLRLAIEWGSRPGA